MDPADRRIVEGKLRDVADTLDRLSMVRGGEWTFDCTLADGRVVKRKFKLYGYEKQRAATTTADQSGTAHAD